MTLRNHVISLAFAVPMLVAAIAETARGTLFFQLFGPTADVSASSDALVSFVRGL